MSLENDFTQQKVFNENLFCLPLKSKINRHLHLMRQISHLLPQKNLGIRAQLLVFGEDVTELFTKSFVQVGICSF